MPLTKTIFMLKTAIFTPDSGSPDGTLEPFVITGLNYLKITPGIMGGIARITLSTMDSRCLDTLKVGSTGRLEGCFRTNLEAIPISYDYGRMCVVSCCPGGHFKAFSTVTVVLVPAKV